METINTSAHEEQHGHEEGRPHHQHKGQGDRMRKLAQALDKATEKTLGSCTLKAFLGCYPPDLVTQHEDLLSAAHERFLTVFHTHVKEELESITERYEVASKLQLIDQWKENQIAQEIRSQSLEPLKASPLELATALEIEAKKQEKAKLVAALQELEDRKERLQKERDAKSEKHTALQKQVEESTVHIEKAVAEAKKWMQTGAKEWQSKQV